MTNYYDPYNLVGGFGQGNEFQHFLSAAHYAPGMIEAFGQAFIPSMRGAASRRLDGLETGGWRG